MTARARLAYRIYRALLLAYPRAFRRDHADDAAETFAELHRETLGWRPRAALWLRTLGHVPADGLRERVREWDPPRRPGVVLRRMARDARTGVRQWRRTPAHVAVATVSLALGVGVNVAVVNLMQTVFRQPPAAADPDRLAVVGVARNGRIDWTFSPDDARALANETSTFTALAAERFGWVWLTGGGEPVELQGSLVSFAYFDVLGLTPAAGRLFHAADASTTGGHTVVVISHALWVSRFGMDRAVVGRVMEVNGQRARIAGVAPEGFRGLYAGRAYDLWMPHDLRDVRGTGETYALLRSGGQFELVGRLASGRQLDEARAEIATLLARRVPPEEPAPRVVVQTPRGAHPDARGVLLATPRLALGAAAALLLLTCLNLGGLLLSRNLARRRELAVRLALGGTRAGLVLQLCAETAVVAAAAGTVGLMAAAWVQQLIARWYAYNLPGLTLTLEPIVVGLTLLLAAAAAVAFSIVPAWLTSRASPMAGLRAQAAAETLSGRGARGRQLLLVVQVALSLMLVAAAAVMSRSLTMALASAGAHPEEVLHYRLRPSRAGYDEAAGRRYHDDLLDRVRRVPGVVDVALARVGTDRGWCCPLRMSPADDPGLVLPRVDNNHVTPAFFAALGIELVAGRAFDAGDRPGSTPVVIVSRALSRRFWPEATPLGRRLRAGDLEYEVVGVAADVHAGDVGAAPVPYAYFAFGQIGQADARLLVRVSSGARSVARDVIAAVVAAGPDVHVGQIGTLAERSALIHAPQRAMSFLLRGCAIAALLLSALGLYAQLSIAVARRRRESAIRLALGAPASAITRRVVWEGLRIVAAGLIIGLAGAWAQAPLLESFLFGVRPAEPVFVLAATLLLIAVGLVAAAVPACRASRIDPVKLLRSE